MAGSTGIWGRGGGRFRGSPIGQGLAGRLMPAALCLAFALLSLPALAADQENSGDEPVGWPLKGTGKALVERDFQRQDPAAPLPQRSEVTDKALAAWPSAAGGPGDSGAQSASGGQGASGAEGSGPAPAHDSTALDETPLAGGGLPGPGIESIDLPPDAAGVTAPADVAQYEIAPLKRFTPPVRHETLLYAPGDFSLTPDAAGRLRQMAMRLRGTDDRISITAHSGDAQISTHEAVKLSFKRAMLVRLYLIEEGVSVDQIDLQALPQAEDGGPADRVTIAPTSQAAQR